MIKDIKTIQVITQNKEENIHLFTSGYIVYNCKNRKGLSITMLKYRYLFFSSYTICLADL